MNFNANLTALRRPIPKLLAGVVAVAAGAAAIFLVLVVLAVDREPVIWQATPSSQRYFSATRDILSKSISNHPQGKDKLKSIALSEEDITALANFVLMRKNLKGFAKAVIENGRLVIQASIKLPVNYSDLFLNLRLIADDAEPRAFVKQVKAGYIALPKPLVRLLGWWLARATRAGRDAQRSSPLIHEVRIGDGKLKVVLNWDKETMGQASDLVADLADRERMRIYYSKLAEVVENSPLRRFIGMNALIQPLFALAKERSGLENGRALEENRALILVLGAYANGRDLAPAIYSGEEPPVLHRREVLLNRRVDAAQHFTASAVLVISGHRAFADMVGLAKEFNDTHGGSGFSFIDLAADRAGALFGRLAVGTEDSARRVQEILSQSRDESAYMPRAMDLPENLDAEEFARQFGEIDDPRFTEMKKLIEDRILACRLYRQD